MNPFDTYLIVAGWVFTVLAGCVAVVLVGQHTIALVQRRYVRLRMWMAHREIARLPESQEENR